MPHTKIPSTKISEYFIATEVGLSKVVGTQENSSLKLLRLPFGDGWKGAGRKGELIQEALDKNRLQHFGWHIDSYDSRRKGDRLKPGRIPSRLLTDICDMRGGVILLHDTLPETVQNLETWMDAISCAGHTFVDHKPFLNDPFFAIEPNPTRLRMPAHIKPNQNRRKDDCEKGWLSWFFDLLG
jgi:hypothetical protein